MEPLQAEDFDPHVGKTFRFEGTPHALSLARVERYEGAAPDIIQRRPFTLIFHGPRAGPALAEGLYACKAEGGPTFELYVSPIHTQRPDRQDYQAAFN